jgi:hypothetical protein
MMAAALALKYFGDTTRKLYLYDTYCGMTKPDAVDVTHDGKRLLDTWNDAVRQGGTMGNGGSVEDVRANMLKTGYPVENIVFVEGDVMNTISPERHDKVAILRLDTDFYQSTKHELVSLYKKLSVGGVLLVDDYGYCRGARLATDEFFQGTEAMPLLVRVNEFVRMGVKVQM